MLLAASDPADFLRWAIDHGGTVVWFVVILLAMFANLARRLGRGRAADGTAPPRKAPDARSAAVRAQIVKLMAPAEQPSFAVPASATNAYAAAPAYQAAPATAAHPQRSRHAPQAPQPQQQRRAGPVTPVTSERILSFFETEEVPRLAILDAFRDPAGARTAVVLAEILAPPVALRPPVPLRW